MLSRRILIPALAVVGLLATACGPANPPPDIISPSDTPTPEAPACVVDSAAKQTTLTDVNKIKVSGKMGEKPSVDMPAPFTIAKTESKVITAGDGPAIAEGGSAEVHYYGVNARTCEVFDSSYGKQPVNFDLTQVVAGFSKGLTGKTEGSRVLLVIPGSDGYDSSGGAPPAIEKGDTLVFVVDIVSVPLDGPEGTPVAPKAGLPTVSGSVDKPVVKAPKTDPPTDLVVQPLIKGTGREVKAEDTITANYQAVSWKTGKVIDQSYGVGPQTAELERLIAGWVKGIPGHTVGSRLLLVIPPELAYPDGKKNPPIEKGDTLVYVVDLLAAS